MEKLGRYDKALVRIITKTLGSDEERNLARTTLADRKHSLNKKFKWSDEKIKKLVALNDYMKEQSLVAVEQYNNLLVKVKADKANGNPFAQDFEVYFRVGLAASKYNDLHPEVEGNTFYRWEGVRQCPIARDNNVITYNDFHGHPINKFGKVEFCYFFKHLIEMSYCSWVDLYYTDQLWIEVIVEYQSVDWQLDYDPVTNKYRSFNPKEE